MAEYTRKDAEALKRDAAQRSQQMYRRMPIPSEKNINNNKDVYTFLPFKEELSPTAYYKNENMNFTKEKEKTDTFPFSLSNGLNISEIFNNIDSDKMMILALLVMLYKDGGDKKLMMALAYLLI